MGSSERKDCFLARAISAVVFNILLAGQFTLDRVGIVYPWPMPLNAILTFAAIVTFIPFLSVSIRSKATTERSVPGFKLVNAFFILLILSAMWSPLSADKIIQIWNLLILLGLLWLLKCALVLAPQTTVTTFLTLSAVSGTIFAMVGLLSAGNLSRLAAFGGGPNVFARVTGMGIVAVIYILVTQRRSPWIAFSLLPLVVATVLSGSRGAMLGTLVAVIVMSVCLTMRAWRRVIVGSVISVPAIAYLYQRYGDLLATTLQRRIVVLTLEEQYTAGRDNLWAAAWDMFMERPLFGWGLGSFVVQNQTYPHNLLLQTAAEIGLCGVILIIAPLLVWIRRLAVARPRDPLIIAPLASAALILVASMFSGGYYDARFFWAYSLIAIAALTRGPSPAYPAGRASRRSRESWVLSSGFASQR